MVVEGEGEWNAWKHGGTKRRVWRKIGERDGLYCVDIHGDIARRQQLNCAHTIAPDGCEQRECVAGFGMKLLLYASADVLGVGQKIVKVTRDWPAADRPTVETERQ